MKRDGFLESLWQAGMQSLISDKALPDKTADVIIVGGGITGITTGLQLQKAGKFCVILEAQNIGFGTTGGTTAHLNNFYDTPYYQIESDFGEKGAELAAQAARHALELINRNVQEYSIECGFKNLPGYLFAKNEEQADELKKIKESLIKYKVSCADTDSIPVDIPFVSAIKIDNQAQFNPAMYVYALAQEFQKAGGMIFQNCRVTDVTTEDEIVTASSTLGKVSGKNLVYATHIPPGVNILHFKCAPYRSYAIAFTLKSKNYPNAMAYDLNDPYHYYRSQEKDGVSYLIAGGEDHKTAHEPDTESRFEKLLTHVSKYFDVDGVAYRWSSQYFEPADGLPYIGHLPGNAPNIYTATGFGGNGMIYGTFSALLLSDIICGNQNEFASLFSPDRIKPVAEFSNMIKESSDVVGRFVGDRISVKEMEGLHELANGEAKVVKYKDHKVALYKDEAGKVYATNPACPHVSCFVGWNNAEKSWDCPCHGSRFSYDGTLLTGPARKDLEKFEV